MHLTDDQRRRYARNIALDGVGEAGQEKLLASSVLLIGAGALGSASIAYLAAAGVGHIGILDYDRVELSNLQRQVLYETADIGRLKTESARDRIEEINPDMNVSVHTIRLDAANAESFIATYDIIADGSDNFATRFAVNDACHRLSKPLISAAIRAWEGQLAVFKSYLGGGEPCYCCFVGASPDDERGCNDAGVIGALTGALGSLQALQVIKELLGIGESQSGKLLLIDALTLRTRLSRITRDPACPCCGAKEKALRKISV
jgi:adenylyltransferase/sulfurtransferase